MLRRDVMLALLSAAAAPAAALGAAAPTPLRSRLAALEARSGGRLGVAVLDVRHGRIDGYRIGERFRMCSTFKALAAGFVLHRADRGEERLDRRIGYTSADLPDYSPVTEKHVASGMTMAELCHAAVTVSDNGAANLLLASFGGPAALTAFLRRIGDRKTRLDRIEPALNSGAADDPRDTTSPAAMAATLRRLVLGDALSPASRARLGAWLVASTTGRTKLRAGIPAGWTVGDKTGSWGDAAGGISNDVAILWPPGRPPMLIAAFLAAPLVDEARSAILADVARIVTA
ncbi:class A beta-lactamase [Sphingomonas profundi]|uniref:class A beta-lactamase n=1 Tax=Alterirhizorhabdus profundi TaxID=2681549 RepID=UPI0012E8D4AE|nr:class A beta-lactamase [Sphingomonas profundi]